MTVVRRRGLPVPAAVLLAAGIACVAGAGAVALAAAPASSATSVTISISRSHYEPSSFTVPAGVPITITLRNLDPIDHEWIVGDDALHARHRTGTEPVHDTRPTEVTIPAGSTRVTVVTFSTPGSLRYICHLPGHEAYGMTGTVTITPGS
jgi:uncharacterized cupredoxin-like copper-binding protein